MDVEVRPARREDATAITQAYLASWTAAYAGTLDPSVLDVEAAARSGHDWLGAVADERRTVLVACAAGDVVGVAEAREPPGGDRDLPEVAMLYVVPSWWGTGVAVALLDGACDWIRRRSYPAARLRVVEVHERARRFYEREGWTVDGTLAPARNRLFPLIYYRRELSP